MKNTKSLLAPSTTTDPRRERLAVALTIVIFVVILTMLLALFAFGLGTRNIYVLVAAPTMAFSLCRVTIWPMLGYEPKTVKDGEK